MRMVPKAIPGRAASTANRAMRFSKSNLDLRDRARRVRAADLESPPELESIPLHPAVESATAQAQGLSRLTHVAVEPLQRFANQDALDLFDAEFLQILPLRSLHIQSEIRDLNLAGVAHQHRTFQGVLQFADVTWPRILHHRLKSGGGKTAHRRAIACRITRQEMCRSAAISSRRSRRAGMWISTVFSRKSKSSLNWPAAIAVCRSMLVAEMTRTLIRLVRDEPTRSVSPVSSTRSNLACCRMGTFPISSRKMVPLSANSKRPMRSIRASVNAPFTWPNNSLSKVPSGSAPVFTATSGIEARADNA